MKRNVYIALVALAVCTVIGLAGCSSGGEASTQGTSSPITSVSQGAPLSGTTTTSQSVTDELSTFKSKDPFVQQAVPATASSGSSSSTNSTSSTSSSTSSTTSSSSTTSTTSVSHVHSLKVLSISTSGPTVSFTVDDSKNFSNVAVGAVVQTTWGQVQVVAIDTSSSIVTLLHGSETLHLSVGQTTFE